MTNYELRITNEEGERSDSHPATTDDGPAAADGQAVDHIGGGMSDLAVVGSEISAAPVEQTSANGASKLLVVEIRASGNWKETCRQSIKLAGRYEGNAMLRLQLAGQDLVMDFPNQRTSNQVELIEKLERLAGVSRVYER
jgi:hypothetical protein